LNDDDVETLARQNETVIKLLGRMAFKEDDVKKIVTTKKQNPAKYIEGYNACDGKHTVSQIAAVVGVKQPTVVPILQQWEEDGIIFEVENPDAPKGGGKFYRKIFPV
jgi:hypothetical protein